MNSILETDTILVGVVRSGDGLIVLAKILANRYDEPTTIFMGKINFPGPQLHDSKANVKDLVLGTCWRRFAIAEPRWTSINNRAPHYSSKVMFPGVA